MEELFEKIEKINANKKSIYQIETWPISKKIFLKGVEKANTFLNGKLPIEFEQFYSISMNLELNTIKKTKYYNKETQLSYLFSLENAFDKFKPNPERILVKQSDYLKIKKSFPNAKYFSAEFSNHEKYNEITRQKVLIHISGTTYSIVVDFYDNSDRGYTLKLLEARNDEICVIHLSFAEFLNYYIYFGVEDYWFMLFTNEYKSTVKNLNTIKGLFGDLETHQDKIKELEKLI
jgi:hypothetical protein